MRERDTRTSLLVRNLPTDIRLDQLPYLLLADAKNYLKVLFYDGLVNSDQGCSVRRTDEVRDIFERYSRLHGHSAMASGFVHCTV
jgi:hypothetical protein